MKNHVWLIYLMFLTAGTGRAQGVRQDDQLNIFLAKKKNCQTEECSGDKLKAYNLKSHNPILSPSDIKLSINKDRANTLSVTVPQSAVSEINKYLDGSQQHHLLFVKDKELVFTPIIREKLQASQFEWTFSDAQSFKKALKRLQIK